LFNIVSRALDSICLIIYRIWSVYGNIVSWSYVFQVDWVL